MDALFTAAALSLLWLLFCLLGLRAASARRYIGASVLFVFVLTTATDLRHLFPSIPRLGTQYNWTGKALELGVDLLALALLLGPARWSRAELGLRWRSAPGTGRDCLRVLLPLIGAELVVLWGLVPAGQPHWEDHLFQLTAPGLTEELAFRGVLLALLDRAFPGRVRLVGAALGWGTVVTSLPFGLWHGLSVSASGHVSLDWEPMLIPTVGGFALAWCRARSGTILVPIALHAGLNEVANLLAWFKTAQA